MKKLISAALSLIMIATCFSSMLLTSSAERDASGLPTCDEDLATTVTISGENFKDMGYAKSGSTTEQPGTFTNQLTTDISQFTTDGDSANNWWSKQGYTAAVTGAGYYGIYSGFDASKASSLTVSNTFHTNADLVKNVKLNFTDTSSNANAIFFQAVERNTNRGSGNYGYYNDIYAGGVRSVGSGTLFTYIFTLTDTEKASLTSVNKTVYANSALTTEYTVPETAVGIMNVNGLNMLVGVVSGDPFGDGKTYYTFLGAMVNKTKTLEDTTTEDVYWLTDALHPSGLGGFELTVDYSMTKRTDGWYLEKISITFPAELSALDGYNGIVDDVKLYIVNNLGSATKDNGNGTYTYTQTVGKIVTGNPIAATPCITANISTSASEPYNKLYLKNMKVSYTEDVSSYLTDFNTAYQAMVEAGVTDTSIKDNDSAYNTYVVPVTTAYNALNDYLKAHLVEDNVTNYLAIVAAYEIGSDMDAFNVAYEEIESIDLSSETFETLTEKLSKIEKCRAEYEALSAENKAYVPAGYLTFLSGLESAYAKMLSSRENAVFSDDFSNTELSSGVWNTDYLNYEYAEGKRAIIYGGNTNTNYWLSRYFKVDSENKIADGAGDIQIANGAATHTLTTSLAENNAHRNYIVSAVRSSLNKEYLPEKTKSISAKFKLNDNSTTGDYSDCVSQTYTIYYGDNDYYVSEKSAAYTDQPTYGTTITVSNSGYITIGAAYYSSATISDTVINHFATVSATGLGSGYDNPSKPGAFATEAIDITSGSLTVTIDFEPVEILGLNANTTTGFTSGTHTLYRQTITVTDGNGKTISEAIPLRASANSNDNITKSIMAYYPTSVSNGFAIGYYAPSGTRLTQTLSFDDVLITGEGYNTVDGATIKITEVEDEQDIKFISSLSANPYYTDNYDVAGYGAIVAVEQYYQTASLKELTLETVETLVNDNRAVVKEVALAEGEGLPATIGVTLKGSGAVADINIGTQYRARTFVKYVSKTDDTDIIYAYSLNTTNNRITDGECVRSVYSTAKSIASAEIAADTESTAYKVLGEECAQDLETAITAIINGTAGKSAQGSYTFGDKSYINGTLLLTFTAKNSKLISE